MGGEGVVKLFGGLNEEAAEQDGESFRVGAFGILTNLPGVEKGTEFVSHGVLGERFGGGAGPAGEASEDEGGECGEDVGGGGEGQVCWLVRW